MGLSYDVGGCTFMAFFVSSPEFFIQIYSTLLAKDDKGISTILGSSIMNIMAIPALCGLYVRGVSESPLPSNIQSKISKH